MASNDMGNQEAAPTNDPAHASQAMGVNGHQVVEGVKDLLDRGILTTNDSPVLGKRKHDQMETEHIDGRDQDRRKGTAPIKAEFLINPNDNVIARRPTQDALDDDVAEGYHHRDRQAESKNSKKKREKNQGQNKNRQFGRSRDEVGLCSTRHRASEFSPDVCKFGDRCKFEHNLRKYLDHHKRVDLTTFGRKCPVWEVKGLCPNGWKCRFVGSHSKEIEHEDGRKELVLDVDEDRTNGYRSSAEDNETGVANSLSPPARIALTKRQVRTPKSDEYIKWLDDVESRPHGSQRNGANTSVSRNSSSEPEAGPDTSKADNAASYLSTPLLPSEKRSLYFSPETPVLAPLTTQGNLPFRRLCTSLGAAYTYSEMAMSMPLLQGQKSEWALLKAHESEIQPPTFTSKSKIVFAYNKSTDLKFGAQIAANKPWVAIKATEILTTLLPGGLRLIDLNVGCPIDLVYTSGAGSALMDAPGKLEKILRGMNAVSNEVPVTCKIRLGTKDSKPTAQKLVDRLILGSSESATSAPSGVAAITLHGRSRQQRYTRSADWEYIAQTASLIRDLNKKADKLADTVKEADPRDLANRPSTTSRPPVFFLGNGDVYSHEHYFDHIRHAGVDTCMLARGALMKPWLFEEIEKGQYLDKTSSERLGYVEKFCRYGLEAWGSDEWGVGQTRRFLLEWLSFACR